jgi:hypothetical protein
MGNSPESTDGVIQFAVNDIFEKRKKCQQEGKQVTIEVSYMEIYMEDCFDLLSSLGEKKKVEVRENSRGETFVEGLTQRLVHSPAEFAACISHACKVRSVSKTAMNSHSSRSHAICTLTIRVVTEDDTIIAKLNLVDLAGSERAKKTMATGDILQEGININKGLLALGNVVSALSSKSKQSESKVNMAGKPGISNGSSHVHVPYRESKLTRLLKDSLGGNGMTVLLACVSPAQSNSDETLNTLRFASRASSIVNVAKVNHEEKTDTHVLNQEVNRLRAQLAGLQAKYDELQQSQKDSKTGMDSRRSSRGEGMSGSITDLLSGSSRLTSCFKSLVMHCFMEDVGIDDEILHKLKEDLATSGELFGCEMVEEEENKLSQSILDDCEISGLLDLEELEDFNCVPPIAKVLDRLTNIESHLKKRISASFDSHQGISAQRTISSAANFASESMGENEFQIAPQEAAEKDMGKSRDLNLSDIVDDSNGILMDISGEELSLSPFPKASSSHYSNGDFQMQKSSSENNFDDSFEQQEVELNHMQKKLMKLTNLGNHYENIIHKLNQEIALLQTGNQQLSSADDLVVENASSANNKTAEPVSEKVKQDLRLKSKELEEKIKILRKKEMEMQKVVQTKDRLTKQLDQKQEQIQTYKKERVKMMRKMQDKEVAHRVETKILVKNDVQARQRAVRAEANAAKLSRNLSSREKFWQSKLDAKKLEMERLKTLLQKREEVKKMRNTFGASMTMRAGTGGTEDSKRVIGWKAQDWKKKFQEVLLVESKIAKCNGNIQFYLQKKRGLQQDRIAVKQKMRKLRQSSPIYKELEEECKMLDSGINSASQTIAQWQMRLEEIEASTSGSSSSTNAGVVTSATKAISFKDFVQGLMSSAGSNINADGKEEWKLCLQTLWEQLRQTLQSLHQLQSEVRDLQLHGMDELNDSTVDRDDGEDCSSETSSLGSAPKRARRSGKRYLSSDDEDVDDGSCLDDTFYPSDEDQDASDSDGDDNEVKNFKRLHKKSQSRERAAEEVRKRSAKRSIEDVDKSEDGDNSDDDDDSYSSDEELNNLIAQSKFLIPKRRRVSKFSFVNDNEEDQDNHALFLLIRNNITTLNDIMESPTYFALAVSLFEMLPLRFVIAKRDSVTDDAITIQLGMDYKKAFTAADAWKQQFPLRTMKHREEAWTKLKGSLALFFSACVMTTKELESDVIDKPYIETFVPNYDNISHQLLKLKVKDSSASSNGAMKKDPVDELPLDAVAVTAEEKVWNKYTVKDLKPFLSERCLPVSGTKKELVARLVSYELRQRSVSTTNGPENENAAMDIDEKETESGEQELEQIEYQVVPLRDRTNYLKSLHELTSSAAAIATAAVAGSALPGTTSGVSKRSFRINLDELTEELENRPSPQLNAE